MAAKRLRAAPTRLSGELFCLGWPPEPPPSKSEFREALATPGRPGVRVIAKRFGVDPGTVQRISRPFDGVGVLVT
jgi:hypothetical protein